jgi:4-hydroxybenzoate polyprenyltransferase
VRAVIYLVRVAAVQTTSRGPLGALFRLARPQGTALLSLVVLFGYGFAHYDGALDLTRPLAIAGVLFAWVWLSAGTLWLNAVLDGDEDGALFAEDRVTRPRGLARWAYAALALAVVLATISDLRAGLACAACATLSMLYSHPRTKWKAHPVLGPMVNAIGYGLLTPLAGWAVVHTPLTVRAAAAFGFAALFVLGATFAAQASQRADDARRGYRTLVVTHGPAACLRATRVCTLAGVAAVGVLAVTNVYPRLLLIGLPFFALADRALVRWSKKPDGGTPGDAATFLLRMLAGGLLLVALACLVFLHPELAHRLFRVGI